MELHLQQDLGILCADSGREGVSDTVPATHMGAVVDRNPQFWVKIASHAGVAHVLDGMEAATIADIALQDDVIPYRGINGGYFLKKSDSFGRVYELHTIFTPEGWGKEAFYVARSMFDQAFAFCDLILTHETEHHQSRPPKTFRFKQMGDFNYTPHGRVRLWSLSKADWESSPARSH